VVKVHDAHGPSVDLVTFGTGSIYFQFGIEERGTAPAGGPCWCWPPREPPPERPFDPFEHAIVTRGGR
jgi:hypothetical protein